MGRIVYIIPSAPSGSGISIGDPIGGGTDDLDLYLHPAGILAQRAHAISIGMPVNGGTNNFMLIVSAGVLGQQAIPAFVMAIGGTVTGGTDGSVMFINPAGILAQDNNNFFWDNANNRLGIVTNAPTQALEVVGNILLAQNLTTFLMSKLSGGQSHQMLNITASNNVRINNGSLAAGQNQVAGVEALIGSGKAFKIQDDVLATFLTVLESNGAVGINTTSPTEFLEVAGVARITGRMQITGATVPADRGGFEISYNVAGDGGQCSGGFELYGPGTTDVKLLIVYVKQTDFYSGATTVAVKKVFTIAANGDLIHYYDAGNYRTEFIDGNGNVTITLTGTTPAYSITNTLRLIDKIGFYNGINTAGWGMPAIYASGRSVAQTGAVANVTSYVVGASDGSFLIQANVLVITSTAHVFQVTVSYTDEGNTARVANLMFSVLTGGTTPNITNTDGAIPFAGYDLRIRAKAGSTIQIATTGTFTTVTYNVEASITQIS